MKTLLLFTFYVSRLTIFFCLLTFAVCLDAQTLYTPPAIEKAYEKGTRSRDGNPGHNYWQNKSEYTIDVTLDNRANTITGAESVKYTNSSPDNLDRLVFRLYPNISKMTGGKDRMIIDELTINGASVPLSGLNYEMTGTNMVIKGLSLPPGSVTNITAKWHYAIDPKTPRTGIYNSVNYFIAYWYPQVAVYDDIDGWDMTEYTGTVEFYNDFNDYDVRITVPNNFCVWATGELQNAELVLAPQIYERWERAHTSQEVVHIISPEDYISRTARFNTDGETNTWNFKASNVPDFTFASSPTHLWDGRAADKGLTGIKSLSDDSNVFVSAAYSEKSEDFKEVAYVTAVTIERMSKEMPGVPFPYPCMTVFNGAGGMESPMMVNQGSSSQRIWMVYVTVHEVAHTYFPFYMGINERKYAWMDEGQAQMLMEYIEWGLDTTIDFRAYDTKRYLDYAGLPDEEPMKDSREATGFAYGSHAYFRPAVAYNILLDMLGYDMYKKCMQEYMKRWNGKHPMPYDYFNTFNDVSGQNLNWFFIPWFFERGYPDLAIKEAGMNELGYGITIEKIGKLPVPIDIRIVHKNGTIEQLIYSSAAHWKSGANTYTYNLTYVNGNTNHIEKIIIGNKYIPDTDTTNNVWRR